MINLLTHSLILAATASSIMALSGATCSSIEELITTPLDEAKLHKYLNMDEHQASPMGDTSDDRFIRRFTPYTHFEIPFVGYAVFRKTDCVGLKVYTEEMMIDSKKANGVFVQITSDIVKRLGEGIPLENMPRGENEADCFEKCTIWIPDNEIVSISLVDNSTTSKLGFYRFPLKDWLTDIGDADHGQYFRKRLKLDENGNSLLWEEIQKRRKNMGTNQLTVPSGENTGVKNGNRGNKIPTSQIIPSEMDPKSSGMRNIVVLGVSVFCIVGLVAAFFVKFGSKRIN